MAGTHRQSILELKDKIFEDTGINVIQRSVSIHEVLGAWKEERLIEMICSSTSSHIQGINRLVYKDKKISLNTNRNSKYVSYFRNLITDIMVGPTSHPWVESFEE